MSSQGIHERTSRGSEPVDLLRVLEAEVAHSGRREVTSGEDEHFGVVRVDRVGFEGPSSDAVVFREEQETGKRPCADPLFISHALRALIAILVSERSHIPPGIAQTRREHSLTERPVKEEAHPGHDSSSLEHKRP